MAQRDRMVAGEMLDKGKCSKMRGNRACFNAESEWKERDE